MQGGSVFPSEFIVDAVLGHFIMRSSGGGYYEGDANSYHLAISAKCTQIGFEFTSVLSSMDSETGFAGETLSFEDLASTVADWADNYHAETIENFADDVRYQETPMGRTAYWAYDTHLKTTPIVFIHGGPGGDSNPVKARRLRTGHPVYLFDQMGCGHSDPIKDLNEWQLGDYINQMVKFINSIPSEKVIIYGSSWGAGLTLAYASATSCEKIEAIIFCSPFFSVTKWNDDMERNLLDMGWDYYDGMKDFVRRRDFGPEFRKMLGEYNSRYLFTLPEHRDWAIDSAVETPNEVFRALCGPNDMLTDGKLKDFEIADRLDLLDIPVLFMAGDSDSVRPERLLEYRKQVKGARVAVIPLSGHVVASEQFEVYRSAINAFLRSLD